jgi:hypothetical protein
VLDEEELVRTGLVEPVLDDSESTTLVLVLEVASFKVDEPVELELSVVAVDVLLGAAPGVVVQPTTTPTDAVIATATEPERVRRRGRRRALWIAAKFIRRLRSKTGLSPDRRTQWREAQNRLNAMRAPTRRAASA